MKEKNRDWHLYTQSIEDFFLNSFESDTSVIWDDIGDIREGVTSDIWREHFQSVVDRYNISCRFALMRILFDMNSEIPAEKIDEKAIMKGFNVEGIGNFPDISATHAQTLTDEEVEQYKALLLRRVEDFDPTEKDSVAPLIDRALALTGMRKKTSLTRDELLYLAHAIHLDLAQMQFLLLRVLGDNESGFSFSKSSDLIDMYGFVRGIPSAEVRILKEEYADWCIKNKVKKISYEDKPVDWTKEVGNSFELTVRKWASSDHKEMKEWLEEKAPYLDIRSKTALRVYRNLAAYAYLYMYDGLDKAVEYVKRCGYCAETENLLFENGKISGKCCEKISDELYKENSILVNEYNIDKTKLIHQIHIDNGDISVNGELNRGYGNSRKRIADILVGKIDPTKGDMLLLVWYIAGNSWFGFETLSKDDKCEHLMAFLDAAEDILSLALLPAFYPVNILEEAMMTSIVLGNSNDSPSEIYEQICAAFTDRGKTKKAKGTKSHTKEEQMDFARRSFKIEGSVAYIAKQFGISKASLYNYRTSYKNEIVEKVLDQEGVIDDIASQIGVKSSEIKKWIKAFEKQKSKKTLNQ